MVERTNITPAIRQLLDRNNVLIRSISLLRHEVREGFLRERKRAILLLRSKIYERELSWLRDPYLDIFDESLALTLKKGEPVIVILPTEDKTRYVIQTRVAEVYLDRFRLKMLDPRRFQRIKPKNRHDVEGRLIPEVIVIRIESGETDILRQCSFDDDRATIMDILLRQGETDENAFKGQLSALPRLSAELVDISLGGLCLQCQNIWDMNLANRILYLNFTLNDLISPDAKEGEKSFSLSVESFAVVRSYRKKGDCFLLHMMFIHPLPEQAVEYFPRPALVSNE